MIQDSDIFLTIAEISATFAGFSAVINALGERGAGALHDVLRLRLVISTSVMVVAAGLMPIAAAGFGFEETASWRAVGLIFLVLIGGIGGSFLNAYRAVRGDFPPDHFAVLCSIALILTSIGCLVAIIVKLAPEQNAALYTTALICALGIAALVFIRLVNSTFNPTVLRDNLKDRRDGRDPPDTDA